jgi:nickel transport protein
MRRLLALPVAAGLCLSASVTAHELWIERSGETYTLYSGHRHPGHAGHGLEAYQPDTVLRSACFAADGNPRPVAPQRAYPLRISGPCAVSYALLSSGYWTKTPYGTKNLPKDQVQMPLRSWRSYEGVKRVDAWSEALGRPLTEDLELVPLHDPLQLTPGDTLRLLVSYRGQPAAGVAVVYDDEPRGKTGADGAIDIRLRHPGFQIIEATQREPSPSAQADEIARSTTLNFELPP